MSSVRTPVGKAYKGTLRATRPDDLAAVAIRGALARVPQLDAKEIEDLILGCAMPEAEQGMNVARIASLRAGLPVEVSAMTINRFCSSGLQAIALASERIRGGGNSGRRAAFHVFVVVCDDCSADTGGGRVGAGESTSFGGQRGGMKPLDHLSDYLGALERRLRLLFLILLWKTR